MRRYLITQPDVAPCIVWADCPVAALAAARDFLGLTPEQSPDMCAAVYLVAPFPLSDEDHHHEQ